MRTLLRGCLLASTWLSPPALLAIGPLLLEDGTRGLWPPLALGAGAVLVAVLLAEPWARLGSPSGSRHATRSVIATPPTLVDLIRQRWPDAGGSSGPVVLAGTGSTLLFVWAQMAAGRELVEALGWPTPLACGLAVLVLALGSWRDHVALPVATALGTVAVVGLALSLGAVLLGTSPAWPRVFWEVATRPRLVFPAEGPWTQQGRPIRGPASELVLPFAEEQRVALLGRGRVRVALWEGPVSTREIRGDTELTLRPGDRLFLPNGFRVRFEAGRSIPGAPASGADWLDPPGQRAGWRPLAGLGVTLALGALGLAAVHAALPSGDPAGAGVAPVAAGLVVLGIVGVTLWALYALWLTPELYAGGIAPVEMFELPAAVPALVPASRMVTRATMLVLAAGGLAATSVALRAVPWPWAIGRGWVGACGVLLAGALLAAATPVPAWPLLLVAIGLAASTSAPLVVLACWSERASARGVMAGAVVGLGLFVGLSVAGLLGGMPAGAGPPLDPGGLRWLLAWPAVVAAPANGLVAWLLSPRVAVSSRSPLPAGLETLHDDT